MTKWIVTAHIAISRHRHVRFTIDNLVKFEAAAFGTSTFTFAVVNYEKRARINIDVLVARIALLKIIAEGEACGVHKLSQFYQNLIGTVFSTSPSSFRPHE